MARTVVWFRRELRLADHPALEAACARGAVLPLFVLDPALLCGHSPRREAWLLAAVRALDADLRAAGAPLVVRRGAPADVAPRVAAEAGVDAVHWCRDYTPYARRRDAAVARALAAIGLEPRTFPGDVVAEPGEVLTAAGGPYGVFTPYHRAWSSLPSGPLPRAPARIVPAASLACDPFAPAEPAGGAGEAAAHEALERFLERGLAGYAERRDLLDGETTSRLSVHLRFGTLSPRQACAAARAAAARDRRLAAGATAFVRQLAWRDFYTQILWHHPETLREPLRRDRRGIRWRDDAAGLDAWREGRTGYPIVDAGMRELGATGWMHGRARMVTASFLVKHLLVDWRLGERWFMAQLRDGDPAQNTGNWQWVASTGADAMPAFRVFNPVLQGRRFDPAGAYVRRWVPELAVVADAHVHAPWEAGGAPGYPAPIVDHQAARARALRVLGAAR